MPKIYTKTGDTGETGLFGVAQRVSKDHRRVQAYGAVDELSAFVGSAVQTINDPHVRKMLVSIQHDLFSAGADLATPHESQLRGKLPVIDGDHCLKLEGWIDQLDACLPPLREFVLPGGTETGARLHLCRVVCRRAERLVVTLAAETQVEPAVLIYLNRLSDLFFVLSRYLNQSQGTPDVAWDKNHDGSCDQPATDAGAEEPSEFALLRQCRSPQEASAVWHAATRERWPVLFHWLDVGVALESLRYHDAVQETDLSHWPRLREAVGEAEAISRLRESPVIVAQSQAAVCHDVSEAATAAAEFQARRCTQLDFLRNDPNGARLESLLRPTIQERAAGGCREELSPQQWPELYQCVAAVMQTEAMRQVMGQPRISHYEVTLGLQNLEAHGVGWHRDQYWPDHPHAITVIISLLDDSAEKGGAFLVYDDRANELLHFHRGRLQTTLIDNNSPRNGRLFHAVSQYLGDDTARHTLIVQCVLASSGG